MEIKALLSFFRNDSAKKTFPLRFHPGIFFTLAWALCAAGTRPLEGSLNEALLANPGAYPLSQIPLHSSSFEKSQWNFHALAFQPFGESGLWAHSFSAAWSYSRGAVKLGHSGWTWEGEAWGQTWDLAVEARFWEKLLIGSAAQWPTGNWSSIFLAVTPMSWASFASGWNAAQVSGKDDLTPWGPGGELSPRTPDWFRGQLWIPFRKSSPEGWALLLGWRRPGRERAGFQGGTSLKLHSCLSVRVGWDQNPGEWTLGVEAGYGAWRWLQMRRAHAFMGATRIQGLVYSP
jgi:hypothetical protein